MISINKEVLYKEVLWKQSDLEMCMYTMLFELKMIKIYRYSLISKYKFTFLHFCTAYKLTSDKEIN